MVTDYKKISENHEKRYGWDKKSRRIYKQLYSEKTHFIYELIQNADDSKSQCLELQLYEKGLLVWNDGSQFSEKDVKKICSLYSSNKDLTQIGSFGIGFKAVYNYTDCPEICSGTERFLIDDLIKPKGIPKSDMNPNVAKLVENGKTVFRLPFKEGLPEEDINQLGKRLRELNVQTLLFLRNLKKVHWSDERKKQNGAYHCTRRSHDIIKNAEEVELTDSLNGNNQTTETFLVFRKEICPPKDVINQLLQQEEYDEDKQRIERSAEKLQPIEVAFKIQDERIIEMDSCVLFAYLPTQMKTNLRFLIQSRYQTTPARDNISINSPWNEWLMKETAEFLPDVLDQLKEGGLLTPPFFNVLPLEDDNVPTEYEPISEALHKAMRTRPFIPIQDRGYAIAKCVLYPHAKQLQDLIESEWMDQNNWLHPEIRDTKELHRCYKIMKEVGVEVASVKRVLRWLENKSKEWFEDRCNNWLYSLYIYLNKQNPELKRIKKLPLLRLENGSHLCASNSPVFFPPNTSKEREDIAPFINELPIVQPTLLEGNDIKTFLKNIGVKTLQPAHLISEYILPKYLESDREPTEEQNRVHIHYLLTVLSKKSTELSKLKAKIRDTPILLAYREEERASLHLRKPCQVYLPQTYTGNADLETYFFGIDNVWYVDNGYLDDNSDPKNWCSFLKEIGVSDIPRVIKKNGEFHLDGLQEVLEKIRSDKNKTLSLALWYLLIKVPSSSDVISCSYLKETAWIPDEHEEFYRPSECFDPTDENRNILGNSVVYLHPDFDISEDNKGARSLAERLGINLDANTDSVLNYLQILSGSKVDIEDIKPLYLFLYQQNASLRDVFKEEHLIYTPNQETCWWRSDEVFWEDESVVFGNNRGYLGAYYQEKLKPFFIALGVTERAAPLDYVRCIQDIASIGKADESEVRERVKILYGRLWQFIKEGGSSLEHEEWQEKWEETRVSKCWLGKKVDEWGFFYWDELVWKDDDNRSPLFKDEIPFWAFDNDMLELAKYINVKGCYQNSEVEFAYYGDRGENLIWSEKVQNLHPYIYDFLNSPRLCKEHLGEKTAEVLCRLTVCIAEKFEARYKLKGISVTDPKPRQSFLDITDQEVKLWLAIEENENDYDWLIGDALQEYFGDVKELGAFVADLLTKPEKVLTRWKPKGLQVDRCVSSLEPDPKASEEPPKSVDEKSQTGTGSGQGAPEDVDFEDKTPIIHERPETGSGSTNSVTEGSETRTDTSPSTSGTSQPNGHSIIRENEGSEKKVDRKEGPEHLELKNNLAANPSQLGAGLKLVKIEYVFKSKDRVDILLEDSFGNPVPVEVETSYSILIERDTGVWQAVKYKHLAAVEYGLPCEHVRSILAAPEIPDDVKAKCKELGIEPIEVSHIQ